MAEFMLFDRCIKSTNHYLALLRRRKEQIRTRNEFEISAVPRPEESSWSYLSRFGSDKALVNLIGINRYGFNRLVKKFRLYYPHRFNKGKGGRPAKVLFPQALGMLLQFYTSPMELKTLGQLHGVRRDQAAKIIKRAEVALSKALKSEVLAKITWPSKEKQKEWAAKIKLQSICQCCQHLEHT